MQREHSQRLAENGHHGAGNVAAPGEDMTNPALRLVYRRSY